MRRHWSGITACRLAAGFGAALLAGALSAAPARVEAIRVAEYDARTRVVIELDQNRSHSLLVLDHQPRVVVDISSSTLHASLPERGRGIVRRMRHARHQDGELRMVFDLRAPATASSVAIAASRPGEGHRIVVDIFSSRGDADAPAKAKRNPGCARCPDCDRPGPRRQGSWRHRTERLVREKPWF